MKRPVIPIPASLKPLDVIARDFEAFLAEQHARYPDVPLPRLLGYVISMTTLGIVEEVGIEAAARFVFETLQAVQFLETIEGCHRTPEGTLVFELQLMGT